MTAHCKQSEVSGVESLCHIYWYSISCRCFIGYADTVYLVDVLLGFNPANRQNTCNMLSDILPLMWYCRFWSWYVIPVDAPVTQQPPQHRDGFPPTPCHCNHHHSELVAGSLERNLLFDVSRCVYLDVCIYQQWQDKTRLVSKQSSALPSRCRSHPLYTVLLGRLLESLLVRPC